MLLLLLLVVLLLLLLLLVIAVDVVSCAVDVVSCDVLLVDVVSPGLGHPLLWLFPPPCIRSRFGIVSYI